MTRIRKGDRVCALLDGGGEERQGHADTDLVCQCWSQQESVKPFVRLTDRCSLRPVVNITFLSGAASKLHSSPVFLNVSQALA